MQTTATGPQLNGSMSTARNADLLYVTDEGNVVYVYSYPNLKLVGQLMMYGLQSPTGECVDSHGSVFVTGFNGHKVFLYPYGGSRPVLTLFDPGYPVGCSIDPTTQSLAVANEFDRSAGPGTVVIWAPANGRPTVYANLQFLEPSWCAYDDKGNLFVDGEDYSTRKSSLAELPKGAASFKKVSLGISLGGPPGNLLWDGKYITAVAGNVIYRLSISDFKARVVGSTTLHALWTLSNYFIVGSQQNQPQARKLVATAGEDIGIFNYPTGTGPTKVITQNYPLDAVVSPASNK